MQDLRFAIPTPYAQDRPSTFYQGPSLSLPALDSFLITPGACGNSLTGSFGARGCGKRRRALADHPRLHGSPETIILAECDDKDKGNGHNKNPLVDDGIEEHYGRIGLALPRKLR